jgi:Zn-dependent protease
MAAFLGWIRYGRGDFQWAILMWIPIVFLAVLLHEMGHALAGKRFGLHPEVQLVAMGGFTTFPHGRRLTHGRSVLVSFAGPAIGLVIGGAAWLLWGYAPHVPHPAYRLALSAIWWTNWGWALFNLVPIVGLDGGNIMAAIFDRFWGPRGVRTARLVSVIVGAMIVALSVAFGQIWIALMIGMLAYQNYRAWQLESQWSEGLEAQARVAKREPPPIEADVKAAWAALEAGDAKQVRRLAESLVPRVRTDEQRFEVAHLLAWGRLLTGDADAAAAALRLLPRGKLPDALLEGAILLEVGRPGDAVRPLAEAIVDRSDDFVATRLAKAAAASGRVDEVIGLLRDRGKAEAIGARALQIVTNELFYAGHHAESAKLGELLFERFGQASDAFNVACSLGQAGRSREGIEWLEKAVEAGLADPKVLDTDADLAPLRDLPRFRTIRAKAGLA